MSLLLGLRETTPANGSTSLPEACEIFIGAGADARFVPSAAPNAPLVGLVLSDEEQGSTILLGEKLSNNQDHTHWTLDAVSNVLIVLGIGVLHTRVRFMQILSLGVCSFLVCARARPASAAHVQLLQETMQSRQSGTLASVGVKQQKLEVFPCPAMLIPL